VSSEQGEKRESSLRGVRVSPSYIYRAERVVNLLEKLTGRPPKGLSLFLAGDVYYAFYLPFPLLRPDPEGLENRWLIMADMLADSRTWRIKALTVADAALSSVAATVFVASLLAGMSQRQGGRMHEEGEQSREEQRKKRGRAISRALQQTMEAVRNAAAAKAIIEKMGAGSTSSLMFEDTLDIILELSRRSDIREVEKILSGIDVSRVSSPRDTASPRGWAGGIEIGGDLERVHPSRLAFPEEVFLAELANSRLLLYSKYLDAERGDVYVLLDKSGSMSGEKMNWARAVAIALLVKARSARRRFQLRFFDSIVYDVIEVGGRAKPRHLAEVLRRVATVKASGGTNITAALARAVEDIEASSRGRSDIVLITDGEDKLSYHIVKSIVDKPGVRLHTVMIKGHNPTLQKVSNTYMVAERLDSGEGLRIVRRALGQV